MKQKGLTTMNRESYRKWLIDAGFPVESDQDVLHIIAERNKGANHPDNYHFVGNHSLNRSLGNRKDHVMAYMVGPEATKRAVSISKKLCQYDGPTASALCHAGEAAFRDQRTAGRGQGV